jgi:UDPglucose 6-dehydrogenase
LPNLGYDVRGFEDKEAVVRDLNEAKAPLFEPGLDDLLRKHRSEGRLEFTTDLEGAVRDSEFVLITYDTPVDEMDQPELAPIFDVAKRIGPHLQREAVVIVSSQIPVGTGAELHQIIETQAKGERFGFAVVPENLRLGQAIHNFMNPAVIAIGADDPATLARVEAFYAALPGRKFLMNMKTAEMTKHALNSFFATSVSFINEIGSLCDEVGADAVLVSEAMRADERIGPFARLRPGGMGFAGATLARDLRALQALGQRVKSPTMLVNAVLRVNEKQKKIVLKKLRQVYGSVANLELGFLGLTYKSGTSTLRRSAALEAIELLRREGGLIRAHDPRVDPREIAQQNAFRMCQSPYQVAAGADALIVVTDWPDYKELDFPRIRASMRTPVLIDTLNMFDKQQLESYGFKYIGIGLGGMPVRLTEKSNVTAKQVRGAKGDTCV